MHYTVAALLFSVAAAQTPKPQPSVAILSLPALPILPLQGIPDVVAGNGYNSIASSLFKAAQSLGVQADGTALANAELTGDISVNPTPNILATLEIVKTAHNASSTLWKLAYDLENKVCSIATSFNQQNVAAQRANLAAAVQAQIVALAKLQETLNATVIAVQSQTAAFSDAEKSILTLAIQAFVTSVLSSSQPLQTLATGLKNIGITGLTEIANALEAQAAAFSTFAAKVNFVGL